MRSSLAFALLAFSVPLAGLFSQGHKPDVAAGKMTMADGFTVSLVAAEPLVRQPVAIDFDDRGRLWVMQYLQYPNPAGLKRVKVDRYSRTLYHRVPAPPPRGPKGDDRLTILLDHDQTSRARRSRDFISGLNLASGFAFGHGGVFVLQAPYLLFYPDRDGDDVPDDDPDVLLEGFGMEDAHSVANSLTWGPDGWLYGCQGSTVTARIRGIEFQQGVWRYHPLTRRFELFCEGGGNSWGLDFDRHGNLLYSTNHGGFVMLHGVQGGYYWKSFGKHGPLHNPHAYGYFDHVPHENFTGGHVTVGGIIYRGGNFPPRFRDRYLAADLLGHNVYWHDVEPLGSSFRSRHGGMLLRSNDTWFAPSDVVLGPDGAVYVADWHDKRTAHPDPDAEWDRSNGRIYRIAARGTKPYRGGDLSKLSRSELLALLHHPNDWFVRRARRILADRRDPEVIFPLRNLIRGTRDEQLALEALWALYVSGGFNERFAAEILDHSNPHVRRWVVRFLGDEGKVSAALARRLADRAAQETHPVARSQLASSAQRFTPPLALDIIKALVRRDIDRHDPHIPLLLWWAVERHVLAARAEIVRFFSSSEALRSSIAQEVILPRLVRRLAAAGTDADLADCAQLITAASPHDQLGLLAALDEGLHDRPVGHLRIPPALDRLLAAAWRDDTSRPELIRLFLRLDRPAAHRRAVAIVSDDHASAAVRVRVLAALGELGRPDCAGAVLELIGGKEPAAVQRAAVDALGRFDQIAVGQALVKRYSRLPAALRGQARATLLGRRTWARLFIDAVERKQISASEVSVEELRPLLLYGDRDLLARARKLWGKVQPTTPEEKLAEVRRLSNDLRAGSGDARAGKVLFQQRCGTCHRLFNEGGTVGPDLTHANRRDRQYLLVSIIDPSAVIRKEYLASNITTKDGRILTGIIAGDRPGHVTLITATAERVQVSRGRIESIQDSPVSLMPEDLLRDLKPQQLRDLFAYLESK
jgi:putative membrane-bound dehydrogenase-like protein